ncbi:MAG: T9SS type A sorting domain-containing protein [Cytophagales bacterium]|nr:T9SS type A sorting domain-containing protein [Cytophagales bacterium]
MGNRSFIIKSEIITLKALLLIVLIYMPNALYSQKTSIISFSPVSGPVGTTVTITGTNFNVKPSENIVFFGATQAIVSSATLTALTVNVPPGASYMPMTVLANGLAYSSEPFTVTFIGERIPGINTDFEAGQSPVSVSIGDLDNDGRADLAVTNQNSNDISIFMNTSTGVGAISFAAQMNYASGMKPVSISMGDLDNDGKLDLAVANQTDNSVSVFRNICTSTGSISFANKEDYTTGAKPRSVTMGDLDGDGWTDLILAAQGGKNVSILRNITGTGTFGFDNKEDFYVGSQLQSVAVGDLDGDGKPDLAVVGKNSDVAGIFRNASMATGNINFDSFYNLIAGSAPSAVAIGDLDDDGKLDLAVINGGEGSIKLYKNYSTSAGTISFDGGTVYNTDSAPHSVSISDLTGDGKPDLMVGYNDVSMNAISVFENTSTSSKDISFNTSAAVYATGNIPGSAVAGDLDNDGRIDLVTANSGDNTVSVLKNSNTETDFTAFSFAEQTGPATIDTINHTIAIEVKYNTDVSALVSTFALSEEAIAAVGTGAQKSGTTSNDFTSPITYTVTAGDGNTTQDWTVMVTIIDDEANQVVVYPNPVSRILNIQSDTFKSATLYGVYGREVLKSLQQQIDLSQLSAGVYILVVEAKTNERTKIRIVKK